MMNIWLSILVLIGGIVLLYFSSEVAVDRLITTASLLGASLFSIGFIVSSIGSDLPEIVNGIISAYLGHGDIAVGNSFGSVSSQISLVLGAIPFFCTFCRLIPRTFAIVGFTEVAILGIALFLTTDGYVSRLDSLLLITLWGASIFIIRRFGETRIAVEESEKIPVKEKPRWARLVIALLISFSGIGIGSYLVVESVISLSETFGISEYFISFFLLSIGTSLPEMVVAISAIKKRYFELAVGDIIGSCIVDLTLAIGIGSLLFPLQVSGRSLLITGIYAGFISSVVVGVLSYRQIHDTKTGALFLLLYLSSWIIPLSLL
jgi:cation:H+ antiporter